MEFVPLCTPNIKGNAEKYVLETIQSGWVSSAGPYVDKFEEDFKKYIGVKHAISVVNGTAALHISLLLCDVEQGDEVLAPNLTFVAPLNAISYVKATPVLLDSCWNTMGLDIDKLEQFLVNETNQGKDGYTYNKITKARIKAIVPMHTFGHPVDMDPLLSLAQKYNIDVIEDATESLGSIYKGKRTGNFSKLACFSFNGNKIMTTGGGGIIVTNDDVLAKKAKHLTTTAKTDLVQYQHDMVGYNYRMVNVLAALGVAQLELMDEFVATKRKNLAIYKDIVDQIDGFQMYTENETHSKSNHWMYSLVRDANYKLNIGDIIKVFTENKIQTRPVWELMSNLPMYSLCQTYHIEASREIYERVLSIPCSTDITEEQINRVCNVLKSL